ncbi:MAG: class I SAM-dependent methyltransferase [Endomicrobiaceae bacterium]|nr:class I SAM-dependent methyltransferase [Endomicrobiaceae bacterium]
MKYKICPVCNCRSFKIKTKLKEDINLCCKCRFLWAVVDNINNPKVDYNLILKSVSSLRTRNFINIITNILTKIRKHKIKGLEIGSATGLFIELAEQKHISMVGIEPMKNSFLEAKKKGLNVINGFFPDDFKNEQKFDFIIFNDTLEHIPNINKIIKECYDRINENGFLIINLPISTGVLYKVASILNVFGITSFFKRLWQFETESPHIYYFNNYNLKILMDKHGFIFNSYVKQDTFVIKGLYDRISVTNKNKIYSVTVFLLLVIFLPLVNILPRDINCLFFQKNT